MGLEVDLARTIVRRNKAKLSGLPDGEKVKAVQSIQKMLAERPIEDLIMMASQRNRVLTPALAEELQTQQQQTRQVEQQSNVPPREPGETRLFTDSEPLPIGVQAERLELREKQEEAELQKLGVETRTELPAGDVAVGFGAEPTEALSRALSEHFGKEVTTFKRGEDILYLDPEDHIVKRAEPDARGKIGLGLPITGDILGTVLGGLLFKRPGAKVAGETGGAGIGAASGEFVRLMVGRALNAHDLDVPQMLAKAGSEGGKAAGATATIGGLAVLGKGVNNWLKGGIFTHEDALRHGLSQEQADAAINEVNKLLRERGVKGTLFTRTGDPAIGAKEAEIRQNIRHAADFLKRDLDDQTSLKKALDLVTQPSEAQGGRAVSEVLGKQLGKRIAQGKKIVDENVSQFRQQLDEIGKIRKDLVGEPTRQVIQAKSSAAKATEDNMWSQVRQAGGFNEKKQAFGIEIPTGENTRQLKDILQRRADTASTVITKRGASKIFSGKNKAADLSDYNRELSDLRAEVRAMSKNRQFGTPQIRDLKAAEQAMVEDRRLALIKMGREDLLRQIENAEEASRKFNQAYNRSVIGDLLEKNENGVFKISDKDFVDSMLKGSSEEADQLLNVIGDRPSLVAKWKEGIADAYKRKAFKNGKFNRNASDEFLESNSDILKRFFTEADIQKFKQTGDLAEKVAKQTAQLDRIINVAAKKWGKGKLKSLDPDRMVDFVTNNSGSFITPTGRGVQTATNKIQYLKNVTKDYPGAWRQFQSEFSNSLRRDVLDNKTGMINPTKIANAVNNNEAVIKEMMGEQYYKNLQSINEVVQLINKSPKPLSSSEFRAGVVQAIRSIAAPPLTRRGRAFTAANIFDTKRAHDVMANALLEPETMKKVAKLAEHKTFNREMAELAASLGILMGDEE